MVHILRCADYHSKYGFINYGINCLGLNDILVNFAIYDNSRKATAVIALPVLPFKHVEAFAVLHTCPLKIMESTVWG